MAAAPRRMNQGENRRRVVIGPMRVRPCVAARRVRGARSPWVGYTRGRVLGARRKCPAILTVATRPRVDAQLLRVGGEALRADAVAEPHVAVLTHVLLDLLPEVFVVADLLAPRADRDQPFQ